MSIWNKIFGSPKLDCNRRFELLETAISGTMSNFYKVKDRETEKIFGLKILDSQKTKQVEERYKSMKGVYKPREGEIAILFKHPYIVNTFEEGFTINNEHYLLMEYLGGKDLNSFLIGKDKFKGPQINYIRQCAEALKVVHKAGFIHRDYCPRNLIFTKDKKILKLTDFGLSLPNCQPFTLPGNRTGTPNYMAPELVRRRQTDERVDIFSFGVTMYELCTRELPWPRGTTGLAAMTHDQPPEPIQTYRPTINPVLANAIHWCIEADPRERCPSLEAFLKRIEKVQHEDLN